MRWPNVTERMYFDIVFLETELQISQQRLCSENI